MSILPCPVCASPSSETLLSLDCGNLDNSKLYPTLQLMACTRCGHSYNGLSPDEISGLVEYYNNEYAPANLSSVVKDGDLPGSTSKFTFDRYNQLYQALSQHITSNDTVLDVGCAVGGFLDFLRERGFSNLYGVDMTEAYVERARSKNYVIEQANASSLPFSEGMFDALVIEQVLEHLVYPAMAFREAGRVLKRGGIFCVGVPDAARYSDFFYFDFYWLLMREHIQHFDITSLNRLALHEGFQLLHYQQTSHPIMSEKMIMPNLCAVFKYNGTDNKKINSIDLSCKILSNSMRSYVEKELFRLSERRYSIKNIVGSHRPVFVWGIGREFLYLYETAGLKYCNIVGLIDMNPFKQETVTVSGMKVANPDILIYAPRDSVLIITSVAHEASILTAVNKLGFKGEIFNLK